MIFGRMTPQNRRKAQAQIVTGMLALAVASIALTKFHNDFLSGLGFGFGVPMISLGVYNFRRH